ncbi:MAG: sulfur oxidation c-type cytochrome SoxA [Gemmobacter sp.]|nr:sulfur oxidation c-type cytochrome SoxA [Gemmobacter sp.]
MKPALAFLLMLGGAANAADPAGVAPVSGYEFMEPATRQLQDDDFLNPAFFLLEQGRALWDQPWPDGQGGARSCRSCHGDPETGMTGVAARYPAFDAESGRMINLELKLSREVADRLGAPAPAYESDALLALTALVALQSRSLPMAIDVDARVQDWVDRGRKMFETRRGQLNLSCKSCHEDNWGQKLRGDTISQGHINAFPIFRLTWDEVGSRHRMFSWCMDSIRSEPYPFGSDEYLALETYLAVRGQGLLIEAPGVRR